MVGKRKREAVTPELLLMRHGAGVKPWHNPAKDPPGPDDVLTAEGYREAQAVGDILAETLNSYAGYNKVVVRYAGPITPASTSAWAWQARRALDGEPGLPLAVGNSPQVDWIAEQLLGRPGAIGRGQIICVGRAARRSRWSVREHHDLLWP